MLRIDGRAADELRPLCINPRFQSYAEGSALIELGRNQVLCTVSIEERVPAFLRGTGQGWITAEYAMLPRATLTRTPREAMTGRVAGRTHEIQRLIGRSLRAAVELRTLGERTLIVDCDVLQADGGTRTASITGGYVALVQALDAMAEQGRLSGPPLKSAVAAISVGLVDGEALLDLCYEEDSQAEADFNVVMTSLGQFVEVQGTAEGKPFSKATMDCLLVLAEKGIKQLFEAQRDAIARLHA